MTELPRWARELPGFDRARWLLGITCVRADGPKPHPIELVAVAYDREGRGLHHGGPGLNLTRFR